MRQMTLADWMPEDCPDFDLSQHMNPPEVLDKDQVEEDPLPTDHTCKEHSLVSSMMAEEYCSRGERKDGNGDGRDEDATF